MNFEMDTLKKKKTLYYTAYSERWNLLLMGIYKIIKITEQNKSTLSAKS